MAVQASPYQYHHHPPVLDPLLDANALSLPTPAVDVAAAATDYDTLGNIGWPQQQQQQLLLRDQQQQQLPTLSAAFPVTGGSATTTGNPRSTGWKSLRDQQYATVAAGSSELHARMPLQHLQQRQRQQHAKLMQDQHRASILSAPRSAAVASTSGRQSVAQGSFMLPPPASHAGAVTTGAAAAAALQEACLLPMFQRDSLDVDSLIRVHDDQLRLALRHIRRRHCLTAAAALERRLHLGLQAKESELSAAILRNVDLQEQVRQTEAETREWMTAAKKGDAVVNELYAELNRATMTEQMLPRDAPGGASCAEEGSGDSGESATEESSRCGGVPEAPAAIDKYGAGDVGITEMAKATATATAHTTRAVCRVCCGGNEATVVLLPCRHLCVCAACEARTTGPGVLACPVCGVLKNESLQIAPLSFID